MYGIEAFGLLPGQMQHSRSDNLKTGGLETTVDFTDQILLDAVRFDDRKSSLQSH
jgi:hypothetical protein